MLLQLPPFPQVPGTHRVVQAPRPQLGTVVGDVYAAGPVRVALELPWEQKKRWDSARGVARKSTELGSRCSDYVSVAHPHKDSWKSIQEHPVPRSASLAKGWAGLGMSTRRRCSITRGSSWHQGQVLGLGESLLDSPESATPSARVWGEGRAPEKCRAGFL